LLQEFSKDAAVIICSEYSLSAVNGAIYPNRLLRDAGLLRVREIASKEYLDFELSDAFAMVDHQIAHIFCKPNAVAVAKSALEKVPGIEFTQIGHARSGELVAVTPPDKWFAYYWWSDWSKAPGFAYSVDIHRKPGYDPCELWFDWARVARTFKIATATNSDLVKGSHGRLPQGDEGWATLLLDQFAASAINPGQTADATDLAPLICRLLLG
jgi:hypothetical protein